MLSLSPDHLLACDLAVEAGERDGEGLHGTHGVLEVQRENVVRYPAKLHHYVVHWREGIVKEKRGLCERHSCTAEN